MSVHFFDQPLSRHRRLVLPTNAPHLLIDEMALSGT